MTSKLDTKELDELIGNIEIRTSNVIRATAFQIQGLASSKAPRDMSRPPKDPSQPVTGALKGGIIAEPISKFLWWVHDSVEYGIFHELGTSRMKARPFMVPAVEKVRARFNQLIAEIFK